jgi:hypothetical protein
MKFLVLLAALCMAGCFGAQYDAINADANRRMSALDAQCKENMTDWCVTQYALIQRQREQELNDLEARRHAFSQSMQEAGRQMGGGNRRNVHCTTQYIGQFAHTDCH